MVAIEIPSGKRSLVMKIRAQQIIFKIGIINVNDISFPLMLFWQFTCHLHSLVLMPSVLRGFIISFSFERCQAICWNSLVKGWKNNRRRCKTYFKQKFHVVEALFSIFQYCSSWFNFIQHRSTRVIKSQCVEHDIINNIKSCWTKCWLRLTKDLLKRVLHTLV